MNSPSRSRNTEVDAYIFIRDNLAKLGWIPRSPLKTPAGQVFTQNECLEEPMIAEQLGLTKPENIVKVSETEYYVIEAKSNRNQLERALWEAENDYAAKINRSSHIKARIISGTAGNESDGYLVRSKFLVHSEFKPIISNDKELTSFVSPSIAEYLISNQTNVIAELPIDEKFFLETAEKINVILHNGAIAATDRGKVISALLLGLIDETVPNVNASPSVLIREINARVNAVLQREGKPEFYNYAKISLPTAQENHTKFKRALVRTIQELNNLNIRSAMNSGTDVLGNFYEVFLKYGNWAKEIGIVLTPRHITKYAAEILDIRHTDIVFDPTCGTGGFLVAAFDYVKNNSTANQVKNFKRDNIFGIEQEPSVVALAIVNMIFRGDGKNNIKEANCFHHWLNLKRRGKSNTAEYISNNSINRMSPVSKVLMNPPFALKEKAEKEYKFVDHALKQMQTGGLLFTILPISEMLSGGQYRVWRQSVLQNNTLVSVITFPPELFYPIGVNTCGVIIRKGIPHPADQKVLWLRGIHDGFVKRKGKRLKPKPPLIERDILSEYREIIIQFIKDETSSVQNIPELCKVIGVDSCDASLELVPEYYLDERTPSAEEIRKVLERLIRQTAGYLMTVSNKNVRIIAREYTIPATKTEIFKLSDLCDIRREYAPYINELLSDNQTTPYVTTTEISNGIAIRCDTEPIFKKHTITVSLDGTCGTTFFQFENFIAGEKTAVLKLKNSLNIKNKLKPHLLFYIASLIRHKSWRYHYGRKLSRGRLEKFEMPLPITSKGVVNIDYIVQLVKSCYGWEVIKQNL